MLEVVNKRGDVEVLRVADLDDDDVGSVFVDDDGDAFIFSRDPDANEGDGCLGVLWLGGGHMPPGQWLDADGCEDYECTRVTAKLVLR